jgi:hypothetical protein
MSSGKGFERIREGLECRTASSTISDSQNYRIMLAWAGSSPGLQKQPRIARGRQNCRRGLWQGRAQFFLPSPDRLRRPGENPVG